MLNICDFRYRCLGQKPCCPVVEDAHWLVTMFSLKLKPKEVRSISVVHALLQSQQRGAERVDFSWFYTSKTTTRQHDVKGRGKACCNPLLYFVLKKSFTFFI